MTTLVFPKHGVDTRLLCKKLRQNYFEYQHEDHYHIFLKEDDPTVCVHEIGDRLIVILGTPVVNGEVVRERSQIPGLLKHVTRQPDAIDSVFSIFIYSLNSRTLEVVTDRFGWITFFLAEDASGTFFSTSLQDVLSLKQFQGPLRINDEAVFEFLWFRRLFGHHSFVHGVETLPYGSRLKFTREDGNTRTWYWAPPSQADQDSSDEELSERMAQSISSGVEMLLKGKEQPGLMLSGGLDSRALLAVGKGRYLSITNTPSENNELLIAEKLAACAGSLHHHILRPADYLSEIFLEACRASRGETLYYECQFLGYQSELAKLVKEIHLGLFLDIFFCGHYMPKYHPSVLGRHALFFLPQKIRDHDLARMFATTVSYRQKQTQLESMMHIAPYREHFEGLIHRVERLLDGGRTYGLHGVQLWEYCHLTNLGRHYSSLMASSLMSKFRIGVPALNNASYDLAFRLPPEKKMNWNVYLGALVKLDPTLMAIPNSNTDIKANLSLVQQTGVKLVKGVINRVANGRYITSPVYSDRSWPAVIESLTKNPKIEKKLLETLQDGRVFENGLLDKSAVMQAYRRTVEGTEDHSIFLNQILTLEYGLFSEL